MEMQHHRLFQSTFYSLSASLTLNHYWKCPWWAGWSPLMSWDSYDVESRHESRESLINKRRCHWRMRKSHVCKREGGADAEKANKTWTEDLSIKRSRSRWWWSAPHLRLFLCIINRTVATKYLTFFTSMLMCITFRHDCKSIWKRVLQVDDAIWLKRKMRNYKSDTKKCSRQWIP